MRQKIPLFDRKRVASTAPNTPSSLRMPWRSRRKEEPRQSSPSQSEFNSIRVNTTDYRSLGLLRQYDDDRINASSMSQPTSERDHRPHSSNTNDLERYPSDNPNPRYETNSRRRPGECLFLTSGYRVNAKGSSSVKELLSSTKDLGNESEDGTFPFAGQSGEGFLIRGKWCLMVIFLVLTVGVSVGLSWYLTDHGSMKKSSVHAFVTANPVARLLGFFGGSDAPPDARNMWINHVVKNDNNQILIAETFESRLNAEIIPLLEKYTGKIWDSGSSSFICHGDDRLMMAFSVAKAGSMPASITYETPCISGPSSRRCVVKKQIADLRDLVVRQPSVSSRYMHSVHLEIDHATKDDLNNSSDVRHIQDLGSVGGEFRVELSDAARLALQRYCGHDKKAFSEDLITEPVSERNTRLINVYELKRLYGLLSNQSDEHVRRSRVWDTRMLSTVVIDPLEHSRHSLAPIHVQQLLSHFRGHDAVKTPHAVNHSPVPHITVSKPRETDQSTPSAPPSPQPSEPRKDVNTAGSIQMTEKEPNTTPSSFNFQPPPTPSITATEESMDHSSDESHDDPDADNDHRVAAELPSSAADEQESENVENDTTEDASKNYEEDHERDTDQETSDIKSDMSQNRATNGPGSLLINNEKLEKTPQETVMSKHSMPKRNDGIRSADLSSGSLNSMNTARSSSVLKDASSSHGSALAQTPSLPPRSPASKNILISSAASHRFLPSSTDGYTAKPSAEMVGAPATVQPNTFAGKPSDSRPDSVRPSSVSMSQGRAGMAQFAGSPRQHLNPSGQDSEARSSSTIPTTQSMQTSPAEQRPSYDQRARALPQIHSSSTEQNLFTGPGKQYRMNAPTSSDSNIRPGVAKTTFRDQGSKTPSGIPLSSSTGGMLGSNLGPRRVGNNVNPQEGMPVSNGALTQSVPPRNVAKTQVTVPPVDYHVQNSLKKGVASSAVVHQPVSVISIMNRKSRERPAD